MKLELTPDELVINLNFWERILAVHGSIRIPLKNVRGATEDDGFRGYGLRSPGTHVPGIITAGTYRKDGDKQFAFVMRRTHLVVIELSQEKWARIILGVPDARSAVLRINAAVGKP